MSVPVISLEPLRRCIPDIDTVAGKINAAAADTGFFYICDHGINADVIATAANAAIRFFEQPAQHKEQITVDQHNRGFMTIGASKMRGAVTYDLKEVFFWGSQLETGDPDVLAGKPLMSINQWPPAMPALRTAILPYYNAVMTCGQAILRALAVSLELDENFFGARYRKPLGRGQLIYYPPRTHDTPEAQFGVAPHADFGCITLLLQDHNGGLQIRGKDGVWLDAPPIPGTLIVNIGDLLQRWSNDRLKSTIHRVMNTSGNKRHSIAVFCDPDTDAVIDPQDMNLPAGHQPRYDPISAGEYIVSRNRASFSHYQDQ